MIKQKWIWGLLLLLLVVSLPGTINRWDAETSNNTYEIVVPFEEIYDLTVDDDDPSLNQALTTLKEAGLTSVSLAPTSLQDLELQEVVYIYTDKELEEILRFSNNRAELKLDAEGHYVTIPEVPFYQEMITDFFPTEELVIADTPYYFIPENEDITIHTDFMYDESAIEQIVNHDLAYVLRVANDENEIVNQHIMNQLIDLKTENIHSILGSGSEFIGYGDDRNENIWPSQLSEAGYHFYLIENGLLKGQYDIAKNTNYNHIRLHSININDQSDLEFSESIDRAIRAVKERNIRSIFYHVPDSGEPVEDLEYTADFIAGLHAEMPGLYTAGIPTPFKTFSIPAWVTAALLLTGIMFTFLAASIVKNTKLQYASAIFMAILAVTYFAINRIIVLQAFALIIAVITPIYAIMIASKGSTKIKEILFQYMKAIGISLVGIFIVIGLLNGNGFITGFEMFRGVKLVYIIPIVVVALFVVWDLGKGYVSKGMFNSLVTQGIRLLNKEVKYWHVIVLLIIAGIGWFYIQRTGNFGFTSGIEIVFRQWLEDTLFVRPRTKEFLIGFPFFVLALYVMGINRKWGSILLIPGVIGLLSIMNTFTHMHIPIYISLLRTFYGVVLGFVIGLLFIWVFKKGYRYLSKAIERWS